MKNEVLPIFFEAWSVAGEIRHLPSVELENDGIAASFLMCSEIYNSVVGIQDDRKYATVLRKSDQENTANTVCEIVYAVDFANRVCQIPDCMPRLLSLLGVSEYGRFAA